MTRTGMILVLALVAIGGLVAAFAPLMQVSYVEAESHIVTESYVTTETYSEEFPIEYEVLGADSANMWWRLTSDCWVALWNKGNVSGHFRVQFDILPEAGPAATKVIWQYVEAGRQTNAVVRYYDSYVKSFTYSITPPVQQVITSREVPGTREVVEYTDVEKTKKVPVLEYLTEWRGTS